MNIYKYGMKYRGFSIGCQPMQNLIEAQEDPTGVYFNILLYSEPLTKEDLKSYQLKDLQPAPDIKADLIALYKEHKPILRDLNEYSRNTAGRPLLYLIRDYSGQDQDHTTILELIKNAKSNPADAGQLYKIIDFMIVNIGG